MEHPWTQASKFRKNQLGGPCGSHVWAIKGPSFCYFYCIFASTCLKCFKIYLDSLERPTECWITGAMLGPCWGHVWAILDIFDHVWPSFPFRPARALKFSRLGKYVLSNISIVCLLFGTISGQGWDNVWPIFTSWPARALKFWGLSQHGIKHMSSKYSVYGVISGPFLDYVGTIFVPILYPDQIEL